MGYYQKGDIWDTIGGILPAIGGVVGTIVPGVGTALGSAVGAIGGTLIKGGSRQLLGIATDIGSRMMSEKMNGLAPRMDGGAYTSTTPPERTSGSYYKRGRRARRRRGYYPQSFEAPSQLHNRSPEQQQVMTSTQPPMVVDTYHMTPESTLTHADLMRLKF